MKLLKLLLFLYFFFVTEAEPQNGTNATLVWWPPDSSSLVLGVHLGAPGGGGGPGAASADVFISLRLDVPDNWGDAASLDALITLVSQEVEVATRLQVIDVLSELEPQAPYTITMAGSLFGGAPDCPFYHETQVASRCGLHVVNVLLGRKAYTPETFGAVMNEVLQSEVGSVVTRGELCTPSGEYSQDILQRALKRILGASQCGRAMPLGSMHGDIAVQQMLEDNIYAIVI